ncbi:MAG: hypothetical protein P8Y45_14670 [Exilibacterium sp.]
MTESDLSLNQNLELGVSLYLTDFNISNLSVDQMGLHSGSDILALMDNNDQKQTITADYTYALIYFKIADQQQGWLVLDANESKAV